MPLSGFATTANEGVARLTRDELTMYFSGVEGASKTSDLYVATRTAVGQPFGAPTRLSVSSDTGVEYDPTISPNWLTLVFTSTRDGPQRIYAATRASTTADFGVPSAMAGVAPANAADVDAQPFITSDGQDLWFCSTRAGGLGAADIWKSTQSGSGFGAPVLVPELNSAAAEALPVLSYDKLTVYFSSNRPGSQGLDVWRAHRSTVRDGFGTAVRVPELSLAGDDYASWISPDNCRLYMASSNNGNVDIYVAQRTP